MSKLTKQQIKNIKELHSRKIYSLKDLATKFNVSISTIKYHTDLEYNSYRRNEYARILYNRLTDKQKKELFKERKDYQTKYHRLRYQNDEAYREKQKKRARECNQRRYSNS